MRTLARAFANLILVSTASTASAAFIELDLLAPGDRLVTRDTELGLDWLDVYVTVNTSADQIRAGAGGWVADGWRHATTAETCSLMTRLLPSTSANPTTSCPGVNFDVSSVLPLTSLLSTDPDYIAGYYADDAISNVVGLVEGRNYQSGGASWAVYGVGAVNSGTRNPGEGNFLVRTIPEPTTASLLSLGLFGLAYKQRQRSRVHSLLGRVVAHRTSRLAAVGFLATVSLIDSTAGAVTIDFIGIHQLNVNTVSPLAYTSLPFSDSVAPFPGDPSRPFGEFSGEQTSPAEFHFSANLMNGAYASTISTGSFTLDEPTFVRIYGWADLLDQDGGPAQFDARVTNSSYFPEVIVFFTTNGVTTFDEGALLSPGWYQFSYASNAPQVGDHASYDFVLSIPEPSTGILLISCLLGLAYRQRLIRTQSDIRGLGKWA